MSRIHSTAIISSSATIADDVTIGAYSIIGDNVSIGTGCKVAAHVTILANTSVGKNNIFHQYSSIGGDNQDLMTDDKPTYLEIGNNNRFHEFVTINRGSVKQNCVTKIYDHNLFMAYSHVGHDSVIHSHAIFANGATIAGHVEVDDYATIGAYCAIHQFCHIGQHSFIARGAMVTQDILPYLIVTGNEPKVHGINRIGLERHGYSKKRMLRILKAYKLIYRSEKTVQQVLIELESDGKIYSDYALFATAIKRAKRGIVR